MGEVYVGLDETLKRRVAMKAIRVEHRLDSVSKARFLREARILSLLDHPNICRVYDFIEGDNRDWLVMELIEGKSLLVALRDHLEPAVKLKIAEQVAAVLVATHAAGVVHRDRVARTSDDYTVLEVWALALLQLRRPGEALPVLRKLQDMGYRNLAFLEQVRNGGLRLPPADVPREGRTN